MRLGFSTYAANMDTFGLYSNECSSCLLVKRSNMTVLLKTIPTFVKSGKTMKLFKKNNSIPAACRWILPGCCLTTTFFTAAYAQNAGKSGAAQASRTVGGRFWYRIFLPYRKSLFFTPNASECASRTPGSLFEHRMRIPYSRSLFPVPKFSNCQKKGEYHLTSYINRPVALSFDVRIWSGVPVATIRPPSEPPPGPMSMI